MPKFDNETIITQQEAPKLESAVYNPDLLPKVDNFDDLSCVIQDILTISSVDNIIKNPRYISNIPRIATKMNIPPSYFSSAPDYKLDIERKLDDGVKAMENGLKAIKISGDIVLEQFGAVCLAYKVELEKGLQIDKEDYFAAKQLLVKKIEEISFVYINMYKKTLDSLGNLKKPRRFKDSRGATTQEALDLQDLAKSLGVLNPSGDFASETEMNKVFNSLKNLQNTCKIDLNEFLVFQANCARKYDLPIYYGEELNDEDDSKSMTLEERMAKIEARSFGNVSEPNLELQKGFVKPRLRGESRTSQSNNSIASELNSIAPFTLQRDATLA
jgi:hypothetical protein